MDMPLRFSTLNYVSICKKQCYLTRFASSKFKKTFDLHLVNFIH